MALYRGIDRCRSCGSGALDDVLDLGRHRLSDFLEKWEDLPPEAPLQMVRCANCTLVQLGHTVDRERLFRRYWYHSGTNETMVAALADVVQDACSRVRLEPGDMVLDIGANDGTLLRQYPGTVMTTAIEPARDFRDALLPVADVVVSDFFPTRLAPGFMAKVITSIACFYASDEPNEFVAAIKARLDPEGVWLLQLQDLEPVVRDRAFDYICHEHLTLWDAYSLDRLLAAHGLEIADISRNDVNGGSVRFTIMHGERRLDCEPLAVDWAAFRDDIARNKTDALRFLERCRRRDLAVAGLAASTKFNTVLQYYGLGPSHIRAIGERHPDKVGRTTVTGIPIVSEEDLRALKPDYVVLGAWQFSESIMLREADMLARGTRPVTFIPRLRVAAAVAGLVAA